MKKNVFKLAYVNETPVGMKKNVKYTRRDICRHSIFRERLSIIQLRVVRQHKWIIFKMLISR